MVLTIRCSTILDRIGVTEIGLRSRTPLIGVDIGTGIITTVCHADGTTSCQSDILTFLVTTLAIHLHNHDRPGMVCYRYQKRSYLFLLT